MTLNLQAMFMIYPSLVFPSIKIISQQEETKNHALTPNQAEGKGKSGLGW